MFNLKGKVALVTGVGSPEGIGFASAKLLAKAGAKLFITSTTKRILEREKELKSLFGNDQPTKKFIEHSLESWNYGIDINLKSTFLVTRYILPYLKKQKFGRIINISSVTGPIVGISGSTVYGSAKAAMLGLTRSLAIEEGKNGITVNCVGPGWIKTGSSSEEEIIAGQFTPIGRPGFPEEIGHTVVFLASKEASYITGQIIFVDGGNTIQEYKVELGR